MLLLVLGTNITVFAQTKEQAAEISSDVPELRAFHTIIFPLWHNAYPAKDITTIKIFIPQIKANMEKMNSAKLPGILQDKENLWKSELVKFNAVAESYYKACSENNDEAILIAVEKLHSAYEAMNRVVKPFVKEMEIYHQTLYMIYHKMYPEKNYSEIAGVMDTLVSQADAITKYPEDKLIIRLKDKTPKYYTISENLYNLTVALKEALKGNDEKKKDAAIEELHTTYQKLQSLFE
jgi:hypothetical protein